MKMGPKTSRLLELMLMVGSEGLMAMADPYRFLREGSGLSQARSADRAFRVIESEGWVKRRAGESGAGEWAFELTEKGKDGLLDGIDPEEAWSSNWDGLWRSVSFDLPQEARAARHQLDAWLAKRRFGHLQGSLWISHRPYAHWDNELLSRRVNPRAVVFQEGRAIGELRDVDYVSKAWSFEAINRSYGEYLQFIDQTWSEVSELEGLVEWRRKEAFLWKQAFDADPFLPASLLPAGYRGKEAWRHRKALFGEIVSKFFGQ